MPCHKRVRQLQLLRQRLDLVTFCFGQPDRENALPLGLPDRQGWYNGFLHRSFSSVLPIDSAYQSRFIKPLKYFSRAWKKFSVGDFEAELSEKRKQKAGTWDCSPCFTHDTSLSK
jgi:hypothetical protein